jgi:hypothetical protein
MKKVIVHPDDVKGAMADLKALCTLYEISLEASTNVPRGQMMVFDYDDERWTRYDESRRGHPVQDMGGG